MAELLNLLQVINHLSLKLSRYDKYTCWKMCFVCLVFFGSYVDSMAEQKMVSKLDTHDALKQFLPLTENIQREIQNPYYAKAVWKLWAIDPTSVIITKPYFKGKFEHVSKRKHDVPVFDSIPGSPMLLQKIEGSTKAGFFDDAYMSLDNGHTGLGYPPKGLFLDAGKMSTAGDHKTRFQLGVNFTSQSYAGRGRAIVDDFLNNLNTEKNFFFANCIRATPANKSFQDNNQESVKDLYDGLHGHSYHSLGQSGSEVHALSKMMIAGASMPRSTKDLLKANGAYAIVLLTLFKASLPYADNRGISLPYEHELRHRPVYSSNGNPKHKHFCSANVYFHGYDEKRHLWEMARLASSMTIAPPVAILQVAGIRIQTPDGIFTQKSTIGKRVKSNSLTAVRVWGEPGETLEVLVDLRKSYDLQSEMLTYSCQRLYPNQKNVEIKNISNGVFAIRVSHDQQLPKGRIPVICTVRNRGEVPSNPVFLNFYWPGEKELSDYGLSKAAQKQFESLGYKKKSVTVNKRPQVAMGILGDSIACKPGETVSVNLEATDPEGYPISIYRRLGQWGTLTKQGYKVRIPNDAQPHIEPIHFIFSDGTGGYSSKKLKLCIGKAQDKLKTNWSSSLLGQTTVDARVTQKGRTFTFYGQSPEDNKREPQGLFAFQTISNDVDLAVKIQKTTSRSDIGILLTNSLDHFSRRAYVGLFQGNIQGQVRYGEQEWGKALTRFDEKAQSQPEWIRVVNRSGQTAVLISQDGQLWDQLVESEIQWFETVYAGILYGGSKDPITCQWLKQSGSLALVSTRGAKKNKDGHFISPLKLEINLPEGHTAYYTLDGSQPNLNSSLVNKIIELQTPGTYQVRIVTYEKKQSTGSTVVTYSVVKGNKG